MDKKQKWNKKYRDKLAESEEIKPNERLASLISGEKAGKAIDIACGLGANSCYLAERGYEVTALDLSEVAVQFVRYEAERKCLAIRAEAVDLTNLPAGLLDGEGYDLAIMTYYLDRSLFSVIKQMVKPGGCFFMETYFKTEKMEHNTMSDQYKLQSNELLDVFADWRILHFDENEQTGKQAVFCQKPSLYAD